MEAGAGRLLVIEDHEAARVTLSEALRLEGYEVAAVENGARALAHVDQEHVDVALLDVSLPDLDGFQVLRELRQRFAPTALPIIMVTGLTDRDSVVHALELGANDYVTKPLDIPIVLARIRTQISLKTAVDYRLDLERDLARRNRDLVRVNRELDRANQHMKDDLNSAALVQQALLPATLPTVEGVEFIWKYQPCQELAGDILNVFRLDDRHVGLYLLDVSGHGVRAALLSVTLSRTLAPMPDQPSLVRRAAAGGGLEPTPPDEVAEELNRRFPLELETEQYFTLFYGVLNVPRRELRYVCAGQPGPVLATRAGKVQDLTEPSLPIGLDPKPNYALRRLALSAGDRVHVYSDGILDARSPQRELFGTQGVMRVLAESHFCSLEQTMSRVVAGAQSWTGRAFEDDVSALGLEIQG